MRTMKNRNVNMLHDIYPNKRDAYSNIENFINSGKFREGRVLVLDGLRRTGKTTMVEQFLSHLPDKSKCAYYCANSKYTMEDVEDMIEEEREKGTEILFIDEITDVPGFAEYSADLADVYAKEGMGIILAGTDSLKFSLAENRSLYGRMVHIHTTYIPFAEHSRVFGTNDIDDYIKYGGLMREGLDGKDDKGKFVYDYRSACRYLDSAVAGNIAHSLVKSPKTAGIIPENELCAIIHKMVEKYSGRFDIQEMTEPLRKSTVTWTIPKLKDIDTDPEIIRELIRPKAKREMVKEILAEIQADTEITTEITDDMVLWLEQYMREMGILSAIRVDEFNKNPVTGWEPLPPGYEYYIVQPAIKYYHLKKQKEYYESSDKFAHLSSEEKVFLQEKLSEKIMGDMTDQIILFDTYNCLNNKPYTVCKPVFKDISNGNMESKGEYDMLIRNDKTGEYYGFEIKHSTEAVKEQSKHLEDAELKALVDEKYGNRKNVAVLYRGKPFKSDTGTVYLNIADFLKTIDRERDIDKTMDLLTKGLETREIPSADTPVPLQDTQNPVSPETISNEDVVNSLEGDGGPEIE